MKLLSTLFSHITKAKTTHRLKDLEKMVGEYTGSDWKEHVLFSEDKYHRNVIYGNETIEMIII